MRFATLRGFLWAANIVNLALAVILCIASCKKKTDEIPYAPVNFDISLNDPAAVDLNAVGGWVYVTGGVKGIIIYRRSLTEYLAYERNCTYQPNGSCARVAMDSTNVQAKDDCCGSVFSIVDGTILAGPATKVLRQYNTSLNGDILHVEN